MLDGNYRMRWDVLENENSIELNNTTATMYFVFNLNRGILPTSKTLTELIVGKTLYEKCDKVYELHFGNNGIFTDTQGETADYRVVDNSLFMNWNDGDGESEHLATNITNEYVEFTNVGEDNTKWYFTHTMANNAPVSSCSDNYNRISYSIEDGWLDTKVEFTDNSGSNAIAIPGDAYIRIVPKSYADQNDYSKAIICNIQDNGEFENNCSIYNHQKDIFDRVLADENETYQVVVFKNHISSDDERWECGEDLYKFVGGAESHWSSIRVQLPMDYQDRSNEGCNSNYTTASYDLNHNQITTSDAIINMDNSSCQKLQFNIKNNEVMPRYLVQITTKFNSKTEFDAAFENGQLHLDSSQLQSAGLEHSNQWVSMDYSNLQLSFVKYPNGYTVYTNGYFFNNDFIISNIIAQNVSFDDLHGYGNSDCGYSSSTVEITYNGNDYHSTSFSTKKITIKEDDAGGWLHIPEIRATLDNEYIIAFKYCAKHSTDLFCDNNDWIVQLADKTHTQLYNGSGGFDTSDDPYNGRIKGSFTTDSDSFSGVFNIDNMETILNN